LIRSYPKHRRKKFVRISIPKGFVLQDQLTAGKAQSLMTTARLPQRHTIIFSCILHFTSFASLIDSLWIWRDTMLLNRLTILNMGFIVRAKGPYKEARPLQPFSNDAGNFFNLVFGDLDEDEAARS